VGRVRQSRRPVCVVIAWGLAWLSGCATLPDVSERPAEHVRAAAHDSPLGRLAEASVSDPSLSGFRLISSGHVSLQIRLKLIEGAQSSIDVQTYQFRGDRSGFLIMRALRDAAARGVRVRVLVDDLYTDGDDLLRLSLAARDGVDVRLFNPFSFGRDSIALRMVGALFGDERLHRRMHNKLMVVDGVLAVLGGRNISDEYFDTQGDQAFYDFDVLVAGQVVPQVAVTFDPYWNSRYSHDVRVVLGESAAGPSSRASSAREPVEPCNPLICAPASAPAEDEQLAWNDFARELDAGRVAMHIASAVAAADPPEKVSGLSAAEPGVLPAGAEVRMRVAMAIREAREELVVVSPYLVPGNAGIQALRAFRERGVRVTLMTNSLSATDEPLVHVGYRRYRADIVRAGVELYEWSPVKSGRVLRRLLGGKTVLRLHVKCALIDSRFVYLGSMNFDPRSRDYNTESGLIIYSPGLAVEIGQLVERMMREGSHRVRLASDGSLRWTYGNSDADEGYEPDTDFWSRFLLDLLSPIVPEQML
jgi:putative cardiolipin synthase